MIMRIFFRGLDGGGGGLLVCNAFNTNNKITIPTHIPKKCDIPFNITHLIY